MGYSGELRKKITRIIHEFRFKENRR